MATSNVITMPASPQAAQPAPQRDTSRLMAMGEALSKKFTQYEGDRKLAELSWVKAARQYLGVYDPEIDQSIPRNRSRAYPKLTRVKCVSMLARLMNLLFQASDKNWGVCPSPVPNLSQEDLQQLLDGLYPPGSNGPPPSDETIEKAICKFAEGRAERLELEIDDQLAELGGSRSLNYVALCRKVLASGIQYGAGVLQGPFVDEQKVRGWTVANGRLTALDKTVRRPRFEFIPIWDYYPDMSAKCFEQMDGQFVRKVMSKAQVVALKARTDFIAPQIDLALRTYSGGNYKRKAFETDLRALGAQLNTAASEQGKFEVIVWDGYVRGDELNAAGATVPQNKLDDMVRAQVWMIGSIVIKAEMDPWVSLLPEGQVMKMYHQFIFEENESFLLGNGLPMVMRDSQMGLCAAVRMAIDNASVQRVFEVNYALLRTDVDISSLEPDMLIPRDDDNPATVNFPAVRPIELPLGLQEMQLLVNLFQSFADQETFVGAATGGDMQKGPSEPFRTAAGASMLRGDAALPFKDAVRNFDVFTESVIGALVQFNMKFNDNPAVKGDFMPVAKGATTLIAKEVQGMQIDQLAQTLTEEEKRYLNPREMLRARLRVRDMDYTAIVYDDAKCDEIDQNISQQQSQAAEQAAKLAEANVRKLLTDSLKNIAQANKNAAGAEAQIATTIMQALEAGLNPDMVASAATPSNGAPNGNNDQPAAAGSATGKEPAASGAGQPPGPGLGGLEAATGAAAAAPRPRAAAMPAE